MKWYKTLFTTLSICISYISYTYGYGYGYSYSSKQVEIELDSLFVDRLSYCTQPQIKGFKCEDCTSQRSLIGIYDPVSESSSQVVVVADNQYQKILVGFRGTINKIKQWTSNLDVVYTKWNVGKVHAGFYKRFDEMKIPVLNLLKEARKKIPTGEIVVSGHSMGAAVATLLASHLKDNAKDFEPTYIYTYGSPRVGDSTFAKYVDSQFGDRLLRIMNDWDMVTDLPPTKFGYRHTGKLITCKTATDDCLERNRLEENPGGIVMALKRTFETAKNVDKCHLTYLSLTIGTKRYKC